MNYFSYPNVLLTSFLIFLTVMVIAGTTNGIVKLFKYIYLVEYKSYPMLIMHSGSSYYAYYEYNPVIKKYVRNDSASYNINDPKIYKTVHTDHILSF